MPFRTETTTRRMPSLTRPALPRLPRGRTGRSERNAHTEGPPATLSAVVVRARLNLERFIASHCGRFALEFSLCRTFVMSKRTSLIGSWHGRDLTDEHASTRFEKLCLPKILDLFYIISFP